MSHVRQQVREAVGALLNASPVEWKKAYLQRVSPKRDVLPYLLVFVESETNEYATVDAGPLQLRAMSLSVLGRVRADIDGDEVEKALDAVAVEVEETLTFATLNTQLSGNLKSLELQSSTSGFVEEENERAFAEIALEWQVQIFTNEGAPETFV